MVSCDYNAPMSEYRENIMIKKHVLLSGDDAQMSELFEERSFVHEMSFSLGINVSDKIHWLNHFTCSPKDIDYLALGWLYSSGRVSVGENPHGISLSQNSKGIIVHGARVLATPDSLKKLPTHKLSSEDVERVFGFADLVLNRSCEYQATRALHGCVLGNAISTTPLMVDLGRHNAIDKAIGWGLENDFDFSSCALFSSGRIPMDSAEKAIRMGIPVIASKTFPTREALELCKAYGVKVLFSVSPESYSELV